MNSVSDYVRIVDGFEKMDFDSVTAMLSSAFWCIGIEKDEVVKGALNSALVVGAFVGDRQVGYARAVSDKTRFAYIMDVYVHQEFQKKGIGQSLVNHILNHEQLADVYQWLLITKDAHEVYGKCGFGELSRPGDWMEIRNPRPERQPIRLT